MLIGSSLLVPTSYYFIEKHANLCMTIPFKMLALISLCLVPDLFNEILHDKSNDLFGFVPSLEGKIWISLGLSSDQWVILRT